MCLNRRPHQGRVHQTQLQSLISRHPGKRHVADLHQARAIAEPASSDWSTSLDIGSDSLANDPDAVFKVADVDGHAAQAEDGVLLEGRLSEYLQLFERCPSFEPDAGGGFGTIDRASIAALGRRLEHPLAPEEVDTALEAFCDGRQCAVDAQRIGFPDFLNMFREHLLDLHQITAYMKLQDLPAFEPSPADVEEAQALAPRAENGVSVIESSEQFDALLALHPDQEVVLLAGLSWCRPCKGLTRPLEKMAAQYGDGAVFAKVMGDHNDSTKRLFKNRLKVRATPHLTIHCKGVEAYMRTGANKSKLEDAVRRFYNTDKFALPKKMLYPPTT